jgi:hypothetical protein
MSFKLECFDSEPECFDSKSECFDSEPLYSESEPKCTESEPIYFDSAPEGTPPCTPRRTGSDAVAPKWQEYFPHHHGSPQCFAPPVTSMAPLAPVCSFPTTVVYTLPVAPMMGNLVPVFALQPAINRQFAGEAWAEPPHADKVHCAPIQELPTNLQATAAALPVTPGNQATGVPLSNLFNATNRQALQNDSEETGPHAEKRKRQSSLPPGFKVDYCESCGKIRSGYRGTKCKIHKDIKECVTDPDCKPCVFGNDRRNESYYVSFCYSFGGCSHALMGMCNRQSRGKSSCNFCHCDAPPSHGPKPQRKARKGQPKQADKPVKPSRSHSAPPNRCTEESPSLASKTLTSEDNLSQTTEAETALSSSPSSSSQQSSPRWL